MSARTGIAWTDATWNPVRGCLLVSAGCTNCYAMKQAHRFSGAGGAYEGLTKMTSHGPVWTGRARVVPEMLDAPLRWRTPRRVFVNSMSDLFHEDVPDDFIAQVFDAMETAQQHTFQILTKRPERMRDWCLRPVGRSRYSWPLPNVHLGVSVEDQATADERIPLLLQTPAAVRFISAEPLLGPIDFAKVPGLNKCGSAGQKITRSLWVIVGGESGPRARPFNVQWARDIIAQCKAAGVPCFVKQLGARPFDPTTRLGGDECIDSMVARMRDTVRDRAGTDPAEWPADLRVREWPEAVA